ncbi:MAG: CDGSH iron-sulfur domain-containing protein, partial [Cyclobacteriaceae bacterium]
MDQPSIPQKNPYVMDLEPGNYAWCACGKSENQPYCDGSHKGSEFTPIVEKITEAKKVAWCGCKHSGNKPYCDGS